MASMNIGGDDIRKSINRQIESGKITEEQADHLWWFFTYCKDRSLSFAEATALLGYKADTTLRRAFSGDYDARPDSVIASIETFRREVGAAVTRKDGFFVETSTARSIWQVCEGAAISQTIAFIFGVSQIGKSEALKHYAFVKEPSKTILLRIPVGASISSVVNSLAKLLYVADRKNYQKTQEKILDAITPEHLLQIDELHQVFETAHPNSRVKIMEYLRQIHDLTGCGMVLCGTKATKDEITRGVMSKSLEQLRRRGTIELNLPPRPTWDDIAAVAAHYGLLAPDDRARALVSDNIHSSGLGKFIKTLNWAKRYAHKKGQPVQWNHYVDACKILKDFEQQDQRPNKNMV